MIIFENVKMTYDEINILRNEISNGQLSLLFEGIRAHDLVVSIHIEMNS